MATKRKKKKTQLVQLVHQPELVHIAEKNVLMYRRMIDDWDKFDPNGRLIGEDANPRLRHPLILEYYRLKTLADEMESDYDRSGDRINIEKEMARLALGIQDRIDGYVKEAMNMAFKLVKLKSEGVLESVEDEAAKSKTDEELIREAQEYGLIPADVDDLEARTVMAAVDAAVDAPINPIDWGDDDDV